MSEKSVVATWELPPIDGPVLARRRRVEQLDALEREAWEKGHAEGREAGIAAVRQEEQAGLAEIERRAHQLASILDFMSKPMADLDDQVQRQLALLAGAIARQVVRRELKTHPDQIFAAIRETVSLLPMTARDVRVHLHPEDAKLVRTRLAGAASERVWTITEDPILTQGGCRVTSEDSTIDAQVEQRIGAAIAAVLGDERNADERNAGSSRPQP
jgi:flagellar assembly protein FliH